MMNLEACAPVRTGEDEAPADAELLLRWRTESDLSAFELLIRRHGGMVLGVCRRILGDADDADDAFQATFLVFVQKAKTLLHPDQVAGWLHAVALRVARKARATRNRRRERETEIVDAPAPANPDTSADLRDLRRTLDAELDRLPEKYRVVIVLCELEGRTLEEAARLLGWPKGTVAGRLSRGREMLRERLSRRGVGLPLFLIGPVPVLATADPSESLVSATLATASGSAEAPARSAALAQAVLRGDSRRRLGLLAILIGNALLLALLGWQVRAATAAPQAPLTPVPVSPSLPPAPPAPAPGGCHCQSS